MAASGSTAADPYDLQRFIAGLGHSATAQKYAVLTLDEAKAYLNHPVLGNRLRECTRLVMSVDGGSVEDIFGYPDHLKFHSSMTLFAHAAGDDQLFLDALRKYFQSEFDAQTIKRLAGAIALSGDAGQ
jgi:uncharacterized protein (DUF1810 family)